MIDGGKKFKNKSQIILLTLADSSFISTSVRRNERLIAVQKLSTQKISFT